ncbi:GNAT family N-acetyltransferase [Caldinitratiruptor microaerophilus]|uniref:N-acetyltransferase domain-containing protein n=1 Tax=Caldinitratiruptor microaerophilus TaxID=671077 RepID=A0AA35CLP7_9FIRM|nr:GNAT family N-acetyltransferase [Caldinitratiruptor microaerophilus]BDG61517.1 hypothetical protein caldi_26070 [Caldinitratiruptor microaerophilus]
MLAGEKVVLRAAEPADAERVQRWLSDVERVWFGPDVPVPSRGAVEKWLTRLGGGMERGTRLWSIDTQDGRHVGLVRLSEAEGPHRRARLDVMVGQPEFQGRGLESDALSVALRQAFRHLNLNRVEGRVPASRPDLVEAYKQAGLVEEARLSRALFVGGQYVDEVVLAALAPGRQAS